MSTPVKLTVDGDGRVHGANVAHNAPFPTKSGVPDGMVVPAGVQGVVMHTMEGNLPGTITTFNDQTPPRKSAHFGVDQDGNIHQFGPVNGWESWAQGAGNPSWYSIEFADDRNPRNPLTSAQVNAGAQLLELLSRPEVGRFKLQVSDSTDTEGFGWHGMGGVGWGDHPDCPGEVRKAQREDIIDLAKVIRIGMLPGPRPFGPVTGLKKVSVGADSVTLSWSAPAVPVENQAVGSYEIALSVGSQLAAEVPGFPHFEPKESGPQTWTGKNLKASTTYTAGVRARDKKGKNAGPWATVTFATPAS